jgi:hypothetical protein
MSLGQTYQALACIVDMNSAAILFAALTTDDHAHQAFRLFGHGPSLNLGKTNIILLCLYVAS